MNIQFVQQLPENEQKTVNETYAKCLDDMKLKAAADMKSYESITNDCVDVISGKKTTTTEADETEFEVTEETSELTAETETSSTVPTASTDSEWN